MADVHDDPTTLTSPAFNRKLFVGLSAGAAGAVSTSAGALAQGTTFGKPHDPIVAENDPAIVAQHVKLARPDATIDAYAAWPKSVTATTPGVVIVQHIWGVDAQIRDTARRYAKEGFVAIAPALFSRTNPPSGDNTSDMNPFRAPASALKDDVVAGDLLAGRDWIRGKAAHSKVGITGFCMGGGIVLRQLIGRTDYDAASMFYGSIKPTSARDAAPTAETFAYASRISVPLMGSFGGRDTSPDIKADEVPIMFGMLKAPHDYKVYPNAGHAFFDDTRGAYNAAAAADAWSRTLRWFHTYLT